MADISHTTFVDEIKSQFKGIVRETASIEIMVGWHELIREMLTEINQCSPTDKNIEIVQIKQKFAELRVYTHKKVSSEIDAIMEKYKALALCRCEFCGETGKEIPIGSCIYVACEECAAKNKQELQEFSSEYSD